MEILYFSDRELGLRPRIEEKISAGAWGGIVAVVQTLLADESFGASFPFACPDGCGVAGASEHHFSLALVAEIPGIMWPLRAAVLPETVAILDLVEFCQRHVAKPIPGSYHDFFQHYHLTFDKEAGQSDFRQRVNRLFSRNGIAYELEEDGQIARLAPEVLREALQVILFKTGDDELDDLLECARKKFLSPDAKIRRESLEKLWDAWERLKTIEHAGDKRASIKALLDQAAGEPKFRDVLEREAKELTTIGNSFQIRHTETTQTPLQEGEHIDYLFHRLFALIRMVLRVRERVTSAVADYR